MKWVTSLLAIACSSLVGSVAVAADRVNIVVEQRGNWDTAVPTLGDKAGIFAKHGIALEILYTTGTGESLQATIAGSADIAIGPGTQGVMAAFSKGAPIRIVGSQAVGISEVFFYVPAGSPIKSFKDFDDKTVAYSGTGSSVFAIIQAMRTELRIAPKPVATGNPSSTFTQVMSGQVDVGWSAPPSGLAALKKGEIRIVARGGDVSTFKDQTVRTILANAKFVETKAEVLARFMQAYRETLDWMYASDQAPSVYAEYAKVSPDLVADLRSEYYEKARLSPDRIVGLDILMQAAINSKFLTQPLSKEELARLVAVPAPIR